MNTTDATRRWLTIGLIALLGVIHSVIAYASISTKSPTFDEPIHALGGYCVRYLDDFRVNPEDPALWHRLHALGSKRDDVQIDLESQSWKELLSNGAAHYQVAHELYAKSAVSLHSIINRERAVMAVFGGVLVVSAGFVARSIARRFGLPSSVAGLCVATLLAFDPTMLAHGPLIKNDVIFALCTLGASAALWSVGRHARWWNVSILIACIALAPVLKFSGVLLGPIMAFCLILRAILSSSWCFGQWTISTRWKRLLAASAMIVVGVAVSYFVVWASYGFRFSIAHDGQPYSFEAVINSTKAATYEREFGTKPPMEYLPVLPIDSLSQFVIRLRDYRLLPEGWLFGLLHVHTFSIERMGYMFGKYSTSGFWYFFPVSILVKTPLATLALVIAAIALVGIRMKRVARSFDTGWYFIAIILPALIYLDVAMMSTLNLGIRHMMPIWPAMFISIGLFAGFLWTKRAKFARPILIALASLAAIETLFAAPNFLSFFNVLFHDPRTRLWITADSNLDWGQDLPALARWQQKNESVQLYLSYFGTDDPASYGIKYINIPPGYAYATSLQWPEPEKPGVIAYSATHLAAIYREDLRGRLEPVRKQQPMEVIGGSIYLYKWPLEAAEDSP
ncbi:MAG TPA: hypothetical protein PK402_01780 [Tepidisphaeraceae bacterium]|nr:hypothetical protein [Tepidisphaeraceae bacterium]